MTVSVQEAYPEAAHLWAGSDADRVQAFYREPVETWAERLESGLTAVQLEIEHSERLLICRLIHLVAL